MTPYFSLDKAKDTKAKIYDIVPRCFPWAKGNIPRPKGNIQGFYRRTIGHLLACPRFPYKHAVNLQFCAFLLFGANDLQICKNDDVSRLTEMEKSAFCRLGTKPLVGLL
jgi:hypothetical protein